jgi:hypothetical protein
MHEAKIRSESRFGGLNGLTGERMGVRNRRLEV